MGLRVGTLADVRTICGYSPPSPRPRTDRHPLSLTSSNQPIISTNGSKLLNPLEHSSYMVWTYNAAGELNYANRIVIANSGLSGDELPSSTSLWTHLLEAAVAVDFIASLQSAMENGESFRREVQFCRKASESQDRHWHVVSVDPNRSADGRIESWSGIAVSIADRMRAEIALDVREEQYQQELFRSTAFQRAVLPPRLPRVPGLTFDAIYEPGLSDENVGGDWYDAVRLLDGRVLLTIGDVSGSGLHAAVVMGVVRQIMRGIAQLHAEPALMLDASDRALRQEYPEVLVTAWVGIVDLVSQTLTYASAGHPSPLLLQADGSVRDLDHLTLPIGLRQGHQGHASTISLESGCALWLYTDGLIESKHDIVEGTRVLEATARDSRMRTVAEPAAMIRHLVIPDGSPDDVAILVVKTDFAESERYISRSTFDSSDADAACEARRAFANGLSSKHFSPIDIANAEVVFGELCGNIKRYAPGIVDVILDNSGEQSVLHVLDRGVGFRHLSRLPSDPLSEDGRGLFIIAAMTTEFTVGQRVGGGSHARAVLVGRYPVSLLRDVTLPATTDQVAENF
jgi:anti-sigma regulatory factor (Ser/Thr protein kinase)